MRELCNTIIFQVYVTSVSHHHTYYAIMRELCNTIIFQVLALSLSLALSLPPSLSFCVRSVCPYDV